MPYKKKEQKIALILLLSFAALCLFVNPVSSETVKAPDFSATSTDGKNFSLSDFRGAPLVLHITNIEIPLCIECEKSLKGQVQELARLLAMDPKVQIVTLNLRKNQYSQDGKSLAEKWWKVNITWPWTEDIEPYTIASKYLDYLNVRGGTSNPTIVLIDKDGNVAAVYHVYKVGEGEIDGVQKAETLQEDAEKPEWNPMDWGGEWSLPDEPKYRPRKQHHYLLAEMAGERDLPEGCDGCRDVPPGHPDLNCALLYRSDDRGILLRHDRTP